MNRANVSGIYCRQEFLVHPVAIYVWPNSEYEIPFFIPLEVWATLFSQGQGGKGRAVTVSVPSLPENVTGVQASINDNKEYLFLNANPRYISQYCVPGRNTLRISNPLALLLNAVVQIELRVALDIEHVIQRIPRDLDSALDLTILSISGERPEVEIMGVVDDNKCPITLQDIKVHVKGKNCKHTRTFDAFSYLKLASETDIWQCPICSAPIFPEDLVRIK